MGEEIGRLAIEIIEDRSYPSHLPGKCKEKMKWWGKRQEKKPACWPTLSGGHSSCPLRMWATPAWRLWRRGRLNLEQNELDLTGQPKFARHLSKSNVSSSQLSLLDTCDEPPLSTE